MSVLYDTSCLNLPLSWDYAPGQLTAIRKIHLPFSNLTWVPFASIPKQFSFKDFFSTHIHTLDGGYVLRGCPKPVAEYLKTNRADCLVTGSEAILKLSGNHVEKESVQKQVRANRKLGSTYEIELNQKTIEKLDRLKKGARHGNKPQLEFVFRDISYEGSRCFVFIDAKKTLQGAITMVKRSETAYNIELMLKHQEANFGVMETIIHDAFYALKKEGLAELGLNEVPFIHLEEKKKHQLNHVERAMLNVARVMKPTYNYQGLHYFKNKFDPVWRDVYLCSSGKIDELLLLEMAFKMGYINLALFQTMNDILDPKALLTRLNIL